MKFLSEALIAPIFFPIFLFLALLTFEDPLTALGHVVIVSLFFVACAMWKRTLGVWAFSKCFSCQGQWSWSWLREGTFEASQGGNALAATFYLRVTQCLWPWCGKRHELGCRLR